MQFIIESRKSGKSTELIKKAAELDAYIIVADKKRAQSLHQLSKKLQINIPFPVTAQEVLQGAYYAEGIKAFLIDDIESFLKVLIPTVPVLAVTGTDVPLFYSNKEKYLKSLIKSIREYLHTQGYVQSCYSTKSDGGTATLDCDGIIEVINPIKPYCIEHLQKTYPQLKFTLATIPCQKDALQVVNGIYYLKITMTNDNPPQKASLNFEELPIWLQKLWEVSPAIAREAEKDLKTRKEIN